MQWSPNKQGKFRNSLDGSSSLEESKGATPSKRLTPQERNTFSTDIVPEKALLVAVCPTGQTMERTEEYLDELAFLLETAGGVTMKRVVQRLERPDTRTYVGSGKLEEIKEYKQALEVDFVVFDDELSPAQLRNLERELECRILDRTTLILDIFAKRARTSTAKTQVELAQLQYMLPRLTRMWTHLERQRGGIGMRGPGETQIETDRRLIKEKISLLKEQLASIDKQKTLQRKNRESLVRVALVGYTNVGKSTLMNVLSKRLHVVDISHPDHEAQMASVNKTLAEIGAADKPTIIVFNKIDAYTYVEKEEDDLSPVTRANWSLEMLQESWMSKQGKTIFISAASKQNLDALRDMLYDEVRRIHAVRYPYNNFLY